MSIKLAVAGGEPIVLDQNEISVGSAQSCGVSFLNMPNIKPKHAIIRMIAGRWLVEAREADFIYVNGDEPKRMQWLTPGDVIRLTLNGPHIVFQPVDGMPVSATGWRTIAESHDGPTSNPGSGRHETTRDDRLAASNLSSTTSNLKAAPPPLPQSGFDDAPETTEFAGYQLKSSTTTETRVDNRPGSSTGDAWKDFVSTLADSESSGKTVTTDEVELLKRMQFDQAEQGEAAIEPESPERAEIKWISMIILRCVLAGLAFLIGWLIFVEMSTVQNKPG